MSDTVYIIEPTEIETVIILSETQYTSTVQSGNITNDVIVSVDNQETIEIKQIVPDNLTVVCCDSSGSVTPSVVDEALSARVLKTKLIADDVISALKLVYQTSNNHCALADKDLSLKTEVSGISLTSGSIGSEVDVLYFGRVEDSFFNFPLNAPLFLGNNGIITNTVPTVGSYASVRIGKSLGAGAVFISIERPILL